MFFWWKTVLRRLRFLNDPHPTLNSDIVSDIPFGSVCGMYMLTFHLASILTLGSDILILVFYLESILTFYLAFILSGI